MSDSIFHAGAAYVGGAFVPLEEAKVSVLDWGVTRSDSVYDVVSVVDGAFFRLDVHLARFGNSMNARRLDIEKTPEELASILHRLVAFSGLKTAYVAMLALRGRPKVGTSRRPQDCVNHMVAYAIPWINVIPKELWDTGATMWIASVPRVPDASVDPHVKNYQWQDLMTGLFEAHDHSFDTTVLCDAHGFVTEGPGFNVFAVHGNQLSTPDRGALQGVTRRTVLELAVEQGMDAAPRAMTREMFETADEVFITTTAGGVMPIRAVGARVLPHNGPGPVYQRLHKAFWDAHQEARFIEPVRYWG